MRTPIATPTLLALALVHLTGCSIALERSSVSSAFASHFDCPNADVSSTSGGYRVEGCGTTAFYHCSAPRYANRGNDDGTGAAVVAGLVFGLLDLALTSGDCFLEHHRTASFPAERPLEQTVERPAPIVRNVDEQTRIKGRVRFLGGQLELLAIPGKYPGHVLLTVHGDQRLQYDGCQPWIVRDRETLRFKEWRARKPYDMLMVVPVEQLRDLRQARRFAGNVCGLRFELGERERQALDAFEQRREVALSQLSPQDRD